MIITGFHIFSLDHIAGASDQMKDIDNLSRDRPTTTINEDIIILTSDSLRLNEVFKRCDPTRNSGNMPDQLAFFDDVLLVLSDLLNNGLE